MKAMIFEDRTGTDLEAYVQDPLFVFEQKFDGARLLARVDPETSKVDFRQRNGKPMKFAAAALHLPKVAESVYHLSSLFSKNFQESNPEGFWLDGEIIPETGTYHVWDVVVDSGIYEKASAYARRNFLERAFEELIGTPEWLSATLKLVRQAHTPDEKRNLAEATIATGSEGFVVKDRRQPYSPGVRVKHSFKVKHIKTAEFVVTNWTKGLNEAGRPVGSADIGVYDPAQDTIITVGSTSLIGKESVRTGDVIEVKYLYWTGGAPIQPRMVRVRPDKAVTDCTLDQFPAYTRDEILWD